MIRPDNPEIKVPAASRVNSSVVLGSAREPHQCGPRVIISEGRRTNRTYTVT